MGDDEKKEEVTSEPAPEKKGNTKARDDDRSTSSDKKPQPSKPWPLREIKDPHEHDVLYGRGGGTNHHIGNKRYRKMVEDRKVDYVNSKRLDKPLVALEIIRLWRAQDPPGRFLKLDEKTGLWHDVGDKKAREKTSQALREKAPELRKQQEVEKLKKDGNVCSDEESGDLESGNKAKGQKQKKKAAFSFPDGEPKKRDPKDLKHLMLARDHSLGRDYLKPDEKVDLDGFSWDEPVGKLQAGKEASSGGSRQERSSYPSSQPEGWGSGRFADIEPTSSMPPPPPGPYSSHSAGSVEFQSRMPPETHMSRDHSLALNPLNGAEVDGPASNTFSREGKSVSGGGIDETWARAPMRPPGQPYGFPPPPRQASQPRFHRTEGSSAFSRTPSGHGDRGRRSSGNVGDSQHRSRSSSGRSVDHEYSQQRPYGNAGSVRREWSGQSDDYRKVAGMVGDDLYDIRRSWSGQSDDYNQGPSYQHPDGSTPYPPPDGCSYSGRDSWSSQPRPYSAAIRERPPEYGPPPPPPQQFSAPHHAPPPHKPPPPSHGQYRQPLRRESSGRMSVDEGKPAASTPVPSDSASVSREKGGSGKNVVKPSLRRKLSGGGVLPHSPQPLDSKNGLARPQPVKRDTSHQCENDETKSRVKRSFVSRDHSLAGNMLSNSDANEQLTGNIFDEDRIKDLETTFQKSHLNSSVTSNSSSTKPRSVSAKSRLATNDAIRTAFVDDARDDSGPMKSDRISSFTPKPRAVSAKGRLTTNDAIGLAFADDVRGDTGPMKHKQGERLSVSREKPQAMAPKDRLPAEDGVGVAFPKPKSLSADQRLTSLGDPVDGNDILIDPLATDEALGLGSSSEIPSSKPGRLSANQRVTTVDALLMEIEDEVDALTKPEAMSGGQRKDTIGAIADSLGDDAFAKAWLDSSSSKQQG